MASTKLGLKVFIACVLIATAFTTQQVTPLKANVLLAKQTHDASVKVKKEEKILLQTIHNSYVRSNPGSEGAKVDTQITPGSTTLEWTLQTLSNGKVSLKSSQGTYLRALSGVNALCDLIKTRNEWTMFDVVRNEDNTISLKSIHNSYVRAWPGESARVDTNPWIGVWERFRIIPKGASAGGKKYKEERMELKTIHNTYVKPWDSVDHSKVDCQSAISSRTEWRVEYYSNGRIAFRSVFGTYISALPGNNALVEMRELKAPTAWETFDLVENDDGTKSFRTVHNTYLRAWPGENGKVDTNPFIGVWERFSFVPSA